MTDSLTQNAWTLIDHGRAADALSLTEPAARNAGAPPNLLMAHAAALKALGRVDDAVAFNRRAVTRAPNDRFAWYNLAATLGDLKLDAEAEAAARRTLALGLDAPEVWLVLGKALQGLRRYDDAEKALLTALARRPNDAAAHLDLAQLRWMRSGRQDEALAVLEAALGKHPGDAGLWLIKSTVLTFAGDHAAADATLTEALRASPSDVLLRLAARARGWSHRRRRQDAGPRPGGPAPGARRAGGPCGALRSLAGERPGSGGRRDRRASGRGHA
ncbi:tetratricopeptide repeat protein [Caulobacter sp. UC70_42]|uniref:tetratricopeptide repeat protein n=1 Tax=Caulobacter sp. UC70_42 TaxID=3374551 RepID=UPI0037571340